MLGSDHNKPGEVVRLRWKTDARATWAALALASFLLRPAPWCNKHTEIARHLTFYNDFQLKAD